MKRSRGNDERRESRGRAGEKKYATTDSGLVFFFFSSFYTRTPHGDGWTTREKKTREGHESRVRARASIETCICMI
jgi:hypothetical protein